MKKTLFSLLGGLAAVLGVLSCNTDNNNTTPPSSAIGIVNASPDAGNVDVYIGGNLAAQNFAYGADTGYFILAPGSYSFQVAPTATSNFAVNTNLSFAPGVTYSVFAIDSLSSMQVAAVTDSFAVPSTDSVLVRFFNFSPNLPPVDLAVTGGAIWFSNRSFNDQSATTSYQAFTKVPAGTYNLELRAAEVGTVVLPAPSITLQGGKVYTLYAKGFVGGTGTQALSLGMVIHNESTQ